MLMSPIPWTTSSKSRQGTLSRRPVWELVVLVLVVITAVVVWVGQGSELAVFSQGIPSPSKGTLEVRLKDHREAIGDFLELEIDVDTVGIHPKGAGRNQGWVTLKTGRDKVDLTKYTDGKSALMFAGKVETGPYEAIDLRIKGLKSILKETRRQVQVTNHVGPIRLVFSVQQKEKTLIVLDLVVMDRRDHPGRGYQLHIKGYELYTNETLIEKIPPG